ELWFRLIIFELDGALDAMGHDLARRATHHVRRVIEIQRSTLDAIHVLETMSSSDFLRFRDHLAPASGFQSAQFREIECLFGHKPGTGGSSGVPYLASTTKHRGFPDLWALRTQLTPGY